MCVSRARSSRSSQFSARKLAVLSFENFRYFFKVYGLCDFGASPKKKKKIILYYFIVVWLVHNFMANTPVFWARIIQAEVSRGANKLKPCRSTAEVELLCACVCMGVYGGCVCECAFAAHDHNFGSICCAILLATPGCRIAAVVAARR